MYSLSKPNHFFKRGICQKKREICGILIYSFRGVYLFSFISFIFLSFRGVFNKMILPLALDGYQMIITNSVLCALLPIRSPSVLIFQRVQVSTTATPGKTQIVISPTQVRILIGGKPVMCRWSGLTNSLGKQKLELSTRT